MKNVQIAFHNVDHSRALSKYIQLKSEGLNKLLKSNENIECLIEHDSSRFNSKLNLRLLHRNISVSSKSNNAFKAVSEVFAKAKRLAIQHHQQLRQKLH
jgi:ribosome-associated translation inhibitor RaiA